MWDRPSHHEDKVLWKLDCGCYLYKSPHAVSANTARKGAQGLPPTCFACPWHVAEGEAPRVSSHAHQAYAVCCSVLSMRRELGAYSGTIAWEAQAVEGERAPYDLYVIGPELLIEVDGEGHSESAMYGVYGVAMQRAIDARKDRAARGAGYMLLRLSFADKQQWRELVIRAIDAAWAAQR